MSNISNQGLKKLSQNISLNVSEVTIYLNVNKYYSNVILDIPLISTYGNDPFNVGIFFNFKNENISEFGKGMRLSFYNHFYRYGNGNVKITSCLDVEEQYSITGIYNAETELKLTGSKIQDNKGNYYEYTNSEQSYPSHIHDAENNIDLYLSTSLEKIQRISNKEENEINSSIIDFVYSNNLVSEVIYRRKISSNQYEDIYKVRLEYDSSFYLTRIRYYRIGTNEETLVKELTISYHSTFVIIEDAILNKGIKVVLTNNVITSYITKHSSGYLENPKATTKFEYGKGTTSIIYPDGKKINYGFTLDNKPLGISDYSYNYSFDEYDDNLHLIKSIKGLCPYNQDNLMIGITPTGCNVKPHFETDISSYSFPRVYGNNYYLLQLQASNIAQFKLVQQIYKGEEIILLCFVKRVRRTSSSSINITLSIGDNYHIKSVKSNNELNEDVFDTIEMVEKIEETIQEVNVKITTSSNDEIYVVPCLFIKKAITYYTYNFDNTIKEITTEGETISYEYDENKDLVLTYGTNQIEERYEEDNLRRLSSRLNLYRNEYYSYSSSFPNQVISCRNKGNISKEETKEERTISSNGDYYTSFINSEGEVLLINECNKYNEVTSYTNEDEVTSCYTYDNKGRITSLSESYAHSSLLSRNNTLQYNSYNKITSITTPCESIYNFYYVDNDKLSLVRAMGYNLIQYTYDEEYKKITSSTYGENYYKEDYEYNDKDLLIKIKTGNTNLFSFLYDDFFRLTNVYGKGGYRRSYTYNSLGAIDTYLDNKINIKYNYNQYSSLESKVVKKNDEERYIKGEVISSSLLVNEKSLIKVEKEYKESDLWLVGFENDASLRANNLVISPLTSINTTSSFIRTVQVSNDKTLTYELNDSSLSLNLGTCVCFFFKFTSISATQTIISLKSKNGNSEVRVEYTNNQFILKVVSSSSSSYTLGYINQEVNIDEWNFCCLNIANGAYRLQRYVLEYGLQINGIKERFTNTSSQRIYMDINSPSYLSFGCQFNGSATNKIQGEVGGIIVSKNGYVDPYKVDNYYQATKRIFLALSRKYIYYSKRDYIIDTQDLDSVSFYPLINGFTNMLVTSSSCVNDVLYNENEEKKIKKLFKYNEVLKASSLQGYGYSIKVKINCSSSFLVSFDFSLDEEVNKKQVLFSGKDSSSNKIKIYIKENKVISFDVNEATYDTGLSVSLNTKHNITFLVREESSYNRKIICYLDGENYSINKTFSYFINGFNIILGRIEEGYSTSSTLGEEKEIEELHGSICDLIITNYAVYDVNSLKNKIQKVIKETKKDDLGRIIKEEINDNNLHYVQEYTYKARRGSENYTSYLIDTKKQLISNALIKEIKYSYDNLGRIIKVQERSDETSSFEETNNYTYDKRGYLVEDKDNTYEYDDNGNITKNGSNILTYYTIEVGGVTKNTDILKFINRTNVLYFSSLPLYPNSYKQIGLIFEGRNLVTAYLLTGEEITYSYNLEGLRISKEIDGVKTTYSYESNKLILQESSSLKLEFLYDEKDNLYGFIKNNNDRYYYLRDALNNILGIINQNGQIIVQYSYTSYGVCSVSGDTSLGIQNPFRYKGYYYDVETNLYYLHSRYYDPSCGRFISPDSIDYLDPTSINGLNLYAYCFNDPINYADPSGHVAISIGLLLAIGGIVGAVIGAGASVAGQYLANGCGWENFSWGQLALDTALGGVSGMLSMSPLGWGTMIAANAGIGFVGAVGGHLINESEFSKLSTWLDIGLSTGLGALVGVVGGPGALNARYLNGAKQTAGFIRAAGLYDDVLTKAVTGFYRTPGIASNALRLSGQNLVKQWNKMVVSQAGKALTKALAYGGTALLIGTAGKGWLYDWYNGYF